MKSIQNTFIALLVVTCALTFGSCSKSEDDKGSMERAGKAVDEALDKAKEQTGKAMEKAGTAMKEAGDRMQQSAEKSGQQ
jgi:hypothetical protein